jgi:hypothetical protein
MNFNLPSLKTHRKQVLELKSVWACQRAYQIMNTYTQEQLEHNLQKRNIKRNHPTWHEELFKTLSDELFILHTSSIYSYTERQLWRLLTNIQSKYPKTRAKLSRIRRTDLQDSHCFKEVSRLIVTIIVMYKVYYRFDNRWKLIVE